MSKVARAKAAIEAAMGSALVLPHETKAGGQDEECRQNANQSDPAQDSHEQGHAAKSDHGVTIAQKRPRGDAPNQPAVDLGHDDDTQGINAETILAMVREGLGITLMPRKLLPSKLEGVAALSLDPPQDLRIGLAVKSQEAAPPGAKLFIQTALTCAQAQAEATA